MKKNPLVSVMVATYNQKDVVEQTLQSIVNQSYDNVEIIISDDCSSDGTQSVLTRFAESNPRAILFLQEKNLGITENYNFLARKCKGKYVTTFSGDDVMMSSKIERQVEVLEADEGSSFCHHAVTVLDYRSNVAGKMLTRKYKNNITTINDVLRGFGIPGSMAVMYRRAVVANPAFEPSIPTASDWLHIIKLTMAGRGIYLNESLCFYRQDSEYNGKDPSSYEGDFLKTIAIARKLYSKPGDEVAKSCDYAAARYFLGAGFRRLLGNDGLRCRLALKYPLRHRALFLPATILFMLSYLSLPKRALGMGKKLFRYFY
jgi:glycosyltransferase involved in cell wall biosynthesis